MVRGRGLAAARDHGGARLHRPDLRHPRRGPVSRREGARAALDRRRHRLRRHAGDRAAGPDADESRRRDDALRDPADRRLQPRRQGGVEPRSSGPGRVLAERGGGGLLHAVRPVVLADADRCAAPADGLGRAVRHAGLLLHDLVVSPARHFRPAAHHLPRHRVGRLDGRGGLGQDLGHLDVRRRCHHRGVHELHRASRGTRREQRRHDRSPEGQGRADHRRRLGPGRQRRRADGAGGRQRRGGRHRRRARQGGGRQARLGRPLREARRHQRGQLEGRDPGDGRQVRRPARAARTPPASASARRSRTSRSRNGARCTRSTSTACSSAASTASPRSRSTPAAGRLDHQHLVDLGHHRRRQHGGLQLGQGGRAAAQQVGGAALRQVGLQHPLQLGASDLHRHADPRQVPRPLRPRA